MSNLFVPRFRREQLQQQQKENEANRNQQIQQQQQQQPQKESDLEAESRKVQQESWVEMHRAINAAVNRVTVENIELTADDLFLANVQRGRGLFCTVLCNAQLASPHLSDVFSALVARINSRVPAVGNLLLRRLLHQLWRTLRLRQLEQVKHTCIFLAHLSMARVASIVIVLKLLALFLCGSSNNMSSSRVHIAAALFAETYKFLDREHPEAFAAVLEPARQLVEDPVGQGLDPRSEEALDGVLKLVREHQLQKEKRSGLVRSASSSAAAAAVAASAAQSGRPKQQQQQAQEKEKELVRNQQALQGIIDEACRFNPDCCHEDIDVDLAAPPPEANPELDKFASCFLSKDAYEKAQLDYQTDVLASAKLSEEDRKKYEDRVAATGAARMGGGGAVRPRKDDGDMMDDSKRMLITPADFNGLADSETAQMRKEIYLIFTSSIRAEEIAHKLLGSVAKIQQERGSGAAANAAMQRQQQQIVSMIVATITKEKSFDPIYAKTAELLCRSGHHSYRDNFEEAFMIAFRAADSYEARQLSILGQLYAHLLRQGAISWRPLSVIDLSVAANDRAKNPNSTAQRNLVTQLLKELAASMGAAQLADRLHHDENVKPHVKKMFPVNSVEDAEFATLFYQAIELRQLAAPMEAVCAKE